VTTPGDPRRHLQLHAAARSRARRGLQIEGHIYAMAHPKPGDSPKGKDDLPRRRQGSLAGGGADGAGKIRFTLPRAWTPRRECSSSSTPGR
jgi:hypothetical protein